MSAAVTAFHGHRRIAGGDRETVTRVLADRWPGEESAICVFDDETGRIVDLDYRGAIAAPPRGAGRPRLGVQAREVTLLPRHWEWLSGQPGGASAALRRLVEEARARGRTARHRQDAAYHFMQAMCGDMPGYEEALRALYRSDACGFDEIVAAWPQDIRRYLNALLFEPAVAGVAA